MPSYSARHLDCLPCQLPPLLLAAALRLLAKVEHNGSSDYPDHYQSHCDGFVVTRYRSRSNAPSPGEECLIEIEAGELLSAIRWRGGRNIEVDFLRRGAWEFGFLQAAGIEGERAPGTEALAMLSPMSSDSYVFQGFSPTIEQWTLSQRQRFAILGDRSSELEIANEGASLTELTQIVRSCYEKSRSPADTLGSRTSSPSFFAIWAWANPSRFSLGWPTQRPLLRYCVSKGAPFEHVAHLLLAFDRSTFYGEMAMAEMLERSFDKASFRP